MDASWGAFQPNAGYDSLLEAYDQEVLGSLYPSLKARLHAIHEHAFYDETSIIAYVDVDDTPRMVFHLELQPALVDSLNYFAKPVAPFDPEAYTARDYLQMLRERSQTLDVYAKGYAHLLDCVLRCSRQCYSILMEAFMQLSRYNHPEPLGEMTILFNGAPPATDARDPTFSLHFEVGVYTGWYTCPECRASVPHSGHYQLSDGNPICPRCENSTYRALNVLR